MISAQAAIAKARRGLTLGALLRWATVLGIVFVTLGQALYGKGGFSSLGAIASIVVIWIVLTIRSLRGSRIAADSGPLIAAGRYEQAEQQITEALDAFSVFRATKLISLHNLALLRQAQNRWQDAAAICLALLGQRRKSIGGLDRASRLILAESLLELGDLPGTQDNIRRLHTAGGLSLNETLGLLAIELDYQARCGAWQAMFADGGHVLMTKVQLAELLPPAQSARAQALLALAAQKLNQPAWADWLRRRVELLTDVPKLCAARPMLSEVMEVHRA